MGHIIEPKGVDFVIKSRHLTKKEEVAISEYIKAYKRSNTVKKSPTKTAVKRKVARKKSTV